MIWFILASACTRTEPCPELSTPHARAPLVRRLVADRGRSEALHARWSDGEHEVEVTFPAAEVHDRLLLGFRPGREYVLELSDPDRSRGPWASCPVVTEALPEHFPDVELTVPDPARVAEGHTLVSMRVADNGNTPSPDEVAAIYDEAGEVIWYLTLDELLQDVRVVPGGVLTLVGTGALNPPSPASLVRFAWDGEQVGQWQAEPGAGTSLDTTWGGNLHHDALLADDGRYWALGRGPVTVPDYPQDYDDPEDVDDELVAYDYVVAFDDAGQVLSELAVAELVPPTRVGHDSIDKTTQEGWRDWAHANALDVDGDQMILSLRNQDAVIAYDPSTAEVNWILGNHDNWPVELQDALLMPTDAGMPWFWHQHAPMMGPDLADGRRQLVLFDNGTHGTAPFSGEEPVSTPQDLTSRVVAYAIDEQALSVEELWSVDRVAGGELYCRAVGDADWLPNGNVLTTWGMVDRLPTGQSNVAAGLGTFSVRVVEIDPRDLSEVWHLYLSAPRAQTQWGWSAYRADRIAPLTEHMRK
ncbi:MAG: aryl-sulfate sulfotransferase [Myxococcales bacterium]|nr:aryl-sulfate sulfotransferase [Myxococcales bacterium]